MQKRTKNEILRVKNTGGVIAVILLTAKAAAEARVALEPRGLSPLRQGRASLSNMVGRVYSSFEI